MLALCVVNAVASVIKWNISFRENQTYFSKQLDEGAVAPLAGVDVRIIPLRWGEGNPSWTYPESFRGFVETNRSLLHSWVSIFRFREFLILIRDNIKCAGTIFKCAKDCTTVQSCLTCLGDLWTVLSTHPFPIFDLITLPGLLLLSWQRWDSQHQAVLPNLLWFLSSSCLSLLLRAYS